MQRRSCYRTKCVDRTLDLSTDSGERFWTYFLTDGVRPARRWGRGSSDICTRKGLERAAAMSGDAVRPRNESAAQHGSLERFEAGRPLLAARNVWFPKAWKRRQFRNQCQSLAAAKTNTT